ncbi:MAG: 2-succinyl-5-enolpyruvyl-6-hydroxy-3-cyclohexene-1-carboxylic-acid synthase [Gemmatimonadales bacterium]|jgi:2-succinyl-5-enolpyruvyl-6-hydroxy-3-cyclohexene-1-carboxylate synthase
MSFAALQAAWAEWLVEGLVAAGVRRAVVSPGSRSTPLVLALARAETAAKLELQIVIDERAAAFVALGQARATGRPGLLVCTSGTAGAHYLPALIEASEARIPLLALTADRPPELQGRGASQTVDQVHFYGHHVRRSFDVGTATAEMRAVDGLLRTAMLAVHASRWPDPGPVHLNVPFRKPLEPDGAAHPAVAALSERVAATLGAGLATPALPDAVPGEEALDDVAARLLAKRRGLIVLGPASPHAAAPADAVAAVAESTGFPVLAEATCQHRFAGRGGGTMFDVSEPAFGAPAFRERCAPELVLQIGAAPTGRALGRWIATSGVERIVLARHGVPEAFNQASRIVVGDLGPTLRGTAERVRAAGSPPVDASWRDEIAAVAARSRELARAAAGPGSQGEAVRIAVEAVPEGGWLMVGNSMPVRDVDLYVPASNRGIGVLSQRGAAGIDGLIAGAAGAASASGRPTVLLLGDVSFQHDVGGLAAAARVEIPLVVVTLSNGGGRLFELLPVRRLPGVEPTFERFFLTRPGLDATAAAAAFGVRSSRTEGAGELENALSEALDAPGASVIEAVVQPDGADAVRRTSEELDAWLRDR